MKKWGKVRQDKQIRTIVNTERKEIDFLKKSLSVISHSATIRLKLTIAFLIPISFIIILGIVSFEKAAEGIRRSYEYSTKHVINMTSKYLQLGVKSMEDLAVQYLNDDTMKMYLAGFYSDDLLKNNEVFKDFTNTAIAKEATDDFISSISVFSDNVKSVTTTTYLGSDICAGYFKTENGKNLEASSKFLWVGSDSFLDEKLGLNEHCYSLRLIKKYSNTDGFIVIDMDNSTVLDILKSMEFDKTGTIGLVTPDGREIISGAKGENAKAIFTDKEFYQKALTSEDTSNAYYVDFDGKENLFIYSKIGDTGAMICAAVPKSTILSQADSIKEITAIIVIIACILAVLIGIFISLGIDKTIRSIIAKLKKAANGDLTVDFSTKRKDEFRILMDEINNTFSNMKLLIGQVKEMSGDVSEASRSVTKTSEIFLKTTEDISIAMNEIEQGVMQQAKDAEECLLQMDNLSNKIVVMSENTDEIGKIAEGTKRRIQEGTIVTGELTNQTKSTIFITTDIVKGIEDLAVKSMSIGSIVNTINEISNQTNLLSLNASIEAARAGEVGRGFAVVADEIRKLSDQTQQSVNDIKHIIESIQDNTKNLEKSARNAEKVITLQDIAVKNTTASYLGINESVDNLMIHLKNIIENVSNIETARASTLGAIENISAVLEEIAASTNNVNQISNNQLQSIDTLNKSASNLNQNSEQLVQEVQKFRVD